MYTGDRYDGEKCLRKGWQTHKQVGLRRPWQVVALGKTSEVRKLCLDLGRGEGLYRDYYKEKWWMNEPILGDFEILGAAEMEQYGHTVLGGTEGGIRP